MGENVGEAVVARVSELLPVLRERAQETEDARVVPAESVKALTGELGGKPLIGCCSRPGSVGSRPTRSRS